MELNWTDYVKPELLVLAPVLYAVGAAAKRSPKVDDRNIPALLGLLGIALAILYLASTIHVYNVQDALKACFTAITQGVLCAGMAVYAHQMKKQRGKLK